jgi:6-phosphogluconolactonase
MTKPLVVYFGTGAMGKGIFVYEMNRETGLLTERSMIEASAPGWIELDPTQQFMYAGIGGNQIASFAVNPEGGALTALNAQPTGTLGVPHINVDPTGRFVVGASYGGGTVCVLPINSDGSLSAPSHVVKHVAGPGDIPGPHADQSQPRAHQCPFDPSGRWVVVNDLGLDRTYVYRLDTASGKLVPNSPGYIQYTRGRGPRHLDFHPNGRLAYVINELSSEMTALSWDPAYGTFQEIQTVTSLPDGWSGRKWSAQVKVHPSGKFVYGSNRGSGGESDDIVVYRIDQATGRMTLSGHAGTLGRVPRNFNIDPSGRFLICVHQDSNNVVPFSIDQETGLLTPTGQTFEVTNAICTQFAPMIA